MKPNTLIALVSGALAGATIALLFAPDRGENIRRRMREKAEHEYRIAKQKLANEARKATE